MIMLPKDLRTKRKSFSRYIYYSVTSLSNGRYSLQGLQMDSLERERFTNYLKRRIKK